MLEETKIKTVPRVVDNQIFLLNGHVYNTVINDHNNNNGATNYAYENGTEKVQSGNIKMKKIQNSKLNNGNLSNSSSDDDDDENVYEIKPSNDETEILLSGNSTEIDPHIPDHETWYAVALQVFIPFMIAGFGTVGAGLVLDYVQKWRVFKEIPEIYILVPALLGLKGNLEMTLASRLSTQANIGNMDKRKELISMVTGNLVLTQLQAIVVGFLAALVALVMGWIPDGNFSIRHALILCSSSVSTASLASLALGIIMIFVIVSSHYCKINPDNVATPIAASLGDLTTLTILANVCAILLKTMEKHYWLPIIITCLFLIVIPVWIVISYRNNYVRDVLYYGWSPVIAGMLISSAGGLILDFAVVQFRGLAVFQPVINGVGGNLVAVQASRLSTALHRQTKPGIMPAGVKSACPNPLSVYFSSKWDSVTTRVLLIMAIPGHLVFIYFISRMEAGYNFVTVTFTILYLIAALIQVAILLYLAQWFVTFVWKHKRDPDNVCIPYLTAIGDLLGTGLLACAFIILSVFDKNV
ncbi:unnamed protein product [Didymodactylos carnosus]|uniref:SLC41A/MgtE integral membrane domain-containing protein n=1 Tax=Didymodactylos carnosus TaxID=1234261 RepID=A0A813R0D6_9BILA|nr:unnamed protein product [Didymodactylos carnosus]CAF0774646.1 unnamed protein product [Didymodactylos carnosus]CAF3499812.1 unnamed protein product [Didymodactylos carnosus]CAF3557122.1 unnamed protein product [Didymodactylos carnosus]